MSANNAPHQSVLKTEAVSSLAIKPGEVYIDCTLGAGGHTKEILLQGGVVVGIDQDESAITLVESTIASKNLTLIHDNFSHLSAIAHRLNLSAVSGILLDLGVSSMQLDQEDRGFSFMRDAQLDMRMTQDLAVTAKDLVNGLGKKELYDLLTTYANEQRARAIAEAIVFARRLKPITTTHELANLIARVYKGKFGKIHPATKTFQALRMAVNDELNSLKDVLPQALDLLRPQGRLSVISFHEGEDRVVKETFKKWQEEGKARQLTSKPVTPSEAEVHTNNRARSAKLRTIEKQT